MWIVQNNKDLNQSHTDYNWLRGNAVVYDPVDKCKSAAPGVHDCAAVD